MYSKGIIDLKCKIYGRLQLAALLDEYKTEYNSEARSNSRMPQRNYQKYSLERERGIELANLILLTPIVNKECVMISSTKLFDRCERDGGSSE